MKKLLAVVFTVMIVASVPVAVYAWDPPWCPPWILFCE
ncbi:hypothetical protein C2W64_03114 [Brevibacillus laterosporus]|nr:hypothetical protein C2W64_03114 [Brevibacillus laterosporus]